MPDLKKLTDAELVAETEKAVTKERNCISLVVTHLKEVECRRLYAQLGYSSMFEYCIKALKYCGASAQLRLDAMRLINTIPEAKDGLENGSLSLTNIGVFQKFIRNEAKVGKCYSAANKKQLLESIAGKSRTDAEKFFYAISPQAIPCESTRVVSATDIEIRFVADEYLVELIGQMRAKLAQSGKLDVSYAEIFKACLEKTLKIPKPATSIDPFSSKQKQSNTTSSGEVNPEQTEFSFKPIKRRKHVSKQIRRALDRRTGHQCTYISSLTGRRCEEKKILEIEHIKPVALGGMSDLKNLTLLCPAHNKLRAIEAFGEEKMKPYLKKAS